MFVVKVEVAPGINRSLNVFAQQSAHDTAAGFVSADHLPATLVPEVVQLIRGAFGQYLKLLGAGAAGSAGAATLDALRQSSLARSLPAVADEHFGDTAPRGQPATRPEQPQVGDGGGGGGRLNRPHDSDCSEDTIPHISDDGDSGDTDDVTVLHESNAGDGFDPDAVDAYGGGGGGDDDNDDDADDDDDERGDVVGSSDVSATAVASSSAVEVQNRHVDVKVVLRDGKHAVIQMGLFDSALDVAMSFVEVC